MRRRESQVALTSERKDITNNRTSSGADKPVHWRENQSGDRRAAALAATPRVRNSATMITESGSSHRSDGSAYYRVPRAVHA